MTPKIEHYVYILIFIRRFNMKAEFNVLVPLDVVTYQFYTPFAEGIFKNLPIDTMENRI